MVTEEEFRRTRLKALVNRIGRGAIARIAEGLDCNPSYVSRMLSDPSTSQHRPITGDTVIALNKLYPGWLSPSPDTKAADKHVEPNAEDGPLLKVQRMVPVVGEVKGGTDGYLDELDYPVGHGDGYVPSPVSDQSAYAVRVRGDSMFPRYKSGEFVILSPSLCAQSGDDVVVIFHDGRKMLKVFGWCQSDEIQLLSINNGYEPVTVSSSEVASMHVVAGTAHRSSIERIRPGAQEAGGIYESDALPSNVFATSPDSVTNEENAHGKSHEHRGMEKPRYRRNS